MKRKDHRNEDVFNIHEVYYGDDGEIISFTVDPIYVQGNSKQELMDDLIFQFAAFGKDILDYDELLEKLDQS